MVEVVRISKEGHLKEIIEISDDYRYKPIDDEVLSK